MGLDPGRPRVEARRATRLPQLREVPRRHDAHRRADRGAAADLVAHREHRGPDRGARRGKGRAGLHRPRRRHGPHRPGPASCTARRCTSSPTTRPTGASSTTWRRPARRQDIFVIGWRNLRGLFQVLARRRRTSCSSATAAIGAGTSRSSSAARRRPSRSVRPRWRPRPARRCCRSPAGATGDDRFVARGLPFVHCASTEPAEIYRATQAVADALAEVIAEDPGQWYMFRPVWPQTDADRAQARAALEAARRGEDWTKIGA